MFHHCDTTITREVDKIKMSISFSSTIVRGDMNRLR